MAERRAINAKEVEANMHANGCMLHAFLPEANKPAKHKKIYIIKDL